MIRTPGISPPGLLSLSLCGLTLAAALVGCRTHPSSASAAKAPNVDDASAAAPSAGATPAASSPEPGPAEALRVEALPTTSSFKAPKSRHRAVPESLEAYHRAWEEAFVEVARTFGMSRMIQLRVHTPERLTRTFHVTSGPLPERELIGLELVSLLDGPARTYRDPYKGYADPGRHERRLAAETRAKQTGFPNNGVPKFQQREPSAFEIEGLAALRQGATVFASADGRQALGAVRARKRCTECHVVEVGELMAAFSYTLRPAKARGSSPEF